MHTVLCETYIGIMITGVNIRKTITISAPITSADVMGSAVYSCEVCVHTSVGDQTPTVATSVVSGANARRALGQALLRVDSMLDYLNHVHPMRFEATNLPYDPLVHEAVPAAVFRDAIHMRKEMRESVTESNNKIKQFWAQHGDKR